MRIITNISVLSSRSDVIYCALVVGNTEGVTSNCSVTEMECLAVALKELKIPLQKDEISSLKCSGNLQHIGYRQHGVLYVYHVIINNGRVEKVQDNVSGLV